MTVLVTGGAGYIGSHAVRALQRAGHQPVVLDNLVYGHRAAVEDVLRVPLVVSQVGDRALLDQVLSGSHPVLADGSCIGDFQGRCHSLAATQAAWTKASARIGSGSSGGLLIHTSSG